MIVALAAFAALALQADRPSSALERALAERACDVIAMSRGLAPSDHEKCVDDQLSSLRDDLGVNLARLTPADRLKLDAACSSLQGAATREAYLDCVGRQLVPLRERLRKVKPAAAPVDAPAVDAAAPPAALVPSPAAPPASRRWRFVAVAGGSIVVLAAAAGAVVVLRKRKPASHVCRQCGTPVADAGALCANCRHQAAEAARRAAAERAAEAEAAVRREKEAAEAAAQLEQRQQEAARQAEIEEEARRLASEEAAEAARQRELAARHQHGAVGSTPGAESDIDPYATLGVARDASPDAIRAAYEEAKAKYDLENVSHLSPEVQQHYREKGEAVERAFKMLSGV